MKRSLLLLSTALVLTGCNENTTNINWFDALKTFIMGDVDQKFLQNVDDIDDIDVTTRQLLDTQYEARTMTGSYLSGRFAQSNFDWETASKKFNEVLAYTPKDLELQRRSMVLSMGAGDYQNALEQARKINGVDKSGSLPQLFLTFEKFKSGNYAGVIADVQKIPDDGISEFIKPLIKGWASAGEKKINITGLNKNIVHFYHSILIADYLNDKASLQTLSQLNYAQMGLSAKSVNQIDKIFKKHGLKSQTSDLVKLIPESERSAAENNPSDITTPVEGMSRALFDMASVLYQDYPDSARLFAEMSLYLNPEENDSRILMAHMAAQFKRYDEAIALFNEIDDSKDPAFAIRIDRQIAELLVESGKKEQAIEILRQIVEKTSDLNAQIQIGDIYREQEDFKQALKEYNKAFDMLDGNVTAKNWNLLYARGISNERLKNWEEAERDLKSALVLEPDHPYILNYLGYSWADQGLHLEEATRMIEKAVRLRPDDGYIVDSLGWVYYKQARYIQAVDMLERAIGLSPYDPTINDHLGDAYWQVGRRNEARFQWQRALSFDPDATLETQLRDKVLNGLPDSAEVKKTGNNQSALSGTIFSDR